MTRPDKNEYFMWLAVVSSTRATCDRRSVGCVIVDSMGRILSTGYNGSAPGRPHCDEVGHMMFGGGCVRTTHAEANAVGYAARAGVSLYGSVAYVTCHPCPDCLKLLIASGVCKIVYLEPYHSDKDHISTEIAKRQVVLELYQGAHPWTEGVTA